MRISPRDVSNAATRVVCFHHGLNTYLGNVIAGIVSSCHPCESMIGLGQGDDAAMKSHRKTVHGDP